MFRPLLLLFYLLEPIVKAEARYCSMEVEGEPKFYLCQRNEYCCNFGCCLSPTFQFYQLWYYWLMVIFMFLLCSGGQWWYRYWLQGRYAGELGSTMACRTSQSHLSQSRRPPRPARVAYHPSRDAVVLHNIWKPNYPGSSSRSSPPPSYSSSGSTNQSTRDLMDIERLAGGVPKPSSYYQSLGPPPTYEQAIRDSAPGASSAQRTPAPVHQPSPEEPRAPVQQPVPPPPGPPPQPPE